MCPENFSQGYFPRLSNIFMQEESYTLSEDFIEFKTWIKNSTKSVYYKDLNYNLNSKGDGASYNLELIFKKNRPILVGNSGLKIIVKDTIDSKPHPFQLILTEEYSAALVDGWFDVAKYNPSDFKMKFKLASFYYNLSEEELIANIINTFIKPLDAEETSVQRLIEDLKIHTSAKNIKVDEKQKEFLTELALQIKNQTGKESIDVLYDLYLKREDKDVEEVLFNLYFKRFSNNNTSNYIDEILSIIVKIELSPKSLWLEFPPNLVKSENNKSILFNFTEINFKPIIQHGKEPHLSVEFSQFIDSNNFSYVSFPSEIFLNLNPYIPSDKRELTKFKHSDIQNFTLKIFKNRFEIYLQDNQTEYFIANISNFQW